MIKPRIADEYLAIPNRILKALGGAPYLRDKLSGSHFEIRHAWPSSPKTLPFGLKFRFRKDSKYYVAQISISCVERSRYELDIHLPSRLQNVLFEDRLTLEEAIAKFFEFASVENAD